MEETSAVLHRGEFSDRQRNDGFDDDVIISFAYSLIFLSHAVS